jgi:hypothetical protein
MQFVAQAGILVLRFSRLIFELVAQRFHLFFGFGAGLALGQINLIQIA